ncbi:MAG TPA: efflux RND transporter periplasmic adaptor subunit [Bacteroidales bacterium]|nr:efflux RND transporter periplasmic adaptor subunit [Bacteroidales bacterium]
MKNLLIVILSVLLSACSNQGQNEETGNAEQPSEKQEGVALTTAQKERAGIQTGTIEQRTLADIIFCTGRLSVHPQDKASVSPSIGGFIQKIHSRTGKKVTQGEVLVTLQHPSFFELQQQYLETKARKDYYYEEYKRQGELTVENAASIKTMQQAKADYLSAEAKYKSLKAQLVLLGVDVAQIEQGELKQAFVVSAPVSGTITSIHGNAGMYIGEGTPMVEIVNDQQLNVVLNVLEKEVGKVDYGQPVTFQTLNSDQVYETTVERIGNKIDGEDKRVPVFATIDNSRRTLKAGMFVEAQLLTAEKKVYALPGEAVFDREDGSIVFVEKDNRYLKVPVRKGLTKDGWYEIIDPDPMLLNQKVVIRGGYYLQSMTEIME